MSDWDDLFVRTNLGEPSPNARIDGLSSPDIIRTGSRLVDPSMFAREDNYRVYPRSEPLRQHFPNYFYVRARNSAASRPTRGQAGLMLTKPALVLWPGGDGWTQLRTPNGRDLGTLQPEPTSGGAIAVTTDPFVYVAADSGHRCLVTWLSTAAHPVPTLPRIERMDELVEFLTRSPNYAYHSIEIATKTTGAVTRTIPFSGGTMPFSLRCGLQVTRCRDFTVSLSFGTPLPGGEYLSLAPTDVSQDETITYLTAAKELPAYWNTYVNYTYEAHGPPPSDFEVTLVGYFDVGPEHPYWDFAQPYERFGVPSGQAPHNRRGIVVGSTGVKADQ